MSVSRGDTEASGPESVVRSGGGELVEVDGRVGNDTGAGPGVGRRCRAVYGCYSWQQV